MCLDAMRVAASGVFDCVKDGIKPNDQTRPSIGRCCCGRLAPFTYSELRGGRVLGGGGGEFEVVLMSGRSRHSD
jgi:hypothetical protein